MTQPIGREAAPVFFDKPKSHCFRLAKNTVAFLRISLSSLRMRFSRRSRSFYWARSKSSFDIMSVSQFVVIHLFSVDMPTPRSSATCLRVSPLVSTIRTASWRNSSVCFSPIINLLCYSKCYQRSGIKPRQVQDASAAIDNWIANTKGLVNIDESLSAQIASCNTSKQAQCTSE